jgi:hypothetical protein
MERARLRKEQMAAQTPSPAGMNDVSRDVRRQIEETNDKLAEQANEKQ